MRIQGSWRLLSELSLAGFILLLSLLLITFGGRIEVPTIPDHGAFWLSFIPAFILANAFGLALHKQSRRGSIFLFAAFLPILYLLSQWILLSTGGLVLGFFVGGLFNLQSLSRSRFSSLAKYARSGSKLFFFLVAFYLFIRLLKFMHPFSVEGMQQAFETGSEEPKNLGITLIIVVSFLLMSTTFIRGVQASEVFVYGPSRSGKTLLLLALYGYFVDFYEGTHREIVLSYDIQEKAWQLSKVSEEKLRIESMLAELEGGITPKSTNRTDLAMYELSGKKNGLLPVKFTFIDYSGEYTEDLDQKKYSEALRGLSEKLSGLNVEALHRQIGTISFLELLKNNYSKEIGNQFYNLIPACIYKRMQTAGKVIFLVDGDYIVDYHGEGRKELTGLFGHYLRLMNQLGPEKSYALVLTKTDKLKDLSEISDNSEKAKDIEVEIFSCLNDIYTFREIQNLAKRIPIYFYTVSVDATLSPLFSKNLPEDQQGITQLFPWRVGEIAKFGF